MGNQSHSHHNGIELKMKMIKFGMLVLVGLTSFNVKAHNNCSNDVNSGKRICVGDIVGYAYNEAVGVVEVVYDNGTANVDWNIAGSGYGLKLPFASLVLKNSPPTVPTNGQVLDMEGKNLGPGSTVAYCCNEAIGTVERVYGRSQTVDVNWNIQGSGYGKNLPATQVRKIKGGNQAHQSGQITDARGNILFRGATVNYNYNEAIGTVDAVYSDGTVDVNWNIRGSGYGSRLPSKDVTRN
jgi:hypothetical protein